MISDFPTILLLKAKCFYNNHYLLIAPAMGVQAACHSYGCSFRMSQSHPLQLCTCIARQFSRKSVSLLVTYQFMHKEIATMRPLTTKVYEERITRQRKSPSKP